MSAGRLRLSSALLLAGACVLAYANGLTGAFIYDDKAIVRDNPRIRSSQRVDEIFTTQYFGGPRGTGTAYRPVLLLSFAAQWWIHGGDPVAVPRRQPAPARRSSTLLLAPLLLRIDLPPPTALGRRAALRRAPDPRRGRDEHRRPGRDAGGGAAFSDSSCSRCAASTAAGAAGSRSSAALVLYALANLTKESAAVAPALLFLLLAWRAEGGLRLAAARPRCGAALPVYAGAAAVLAGVFRLRALVLGGALKASAHGDLRGGESARAARRRGRARANACAIFFRYLGTDGRSRCGSRSDESAWSIRPLTPRDALVLGGPVAARRARRRCAPARLRDRVAGGARFSLSLRRVAADVEPALSDRHDLRGAPRLPAVGGLLPDRRLVDRRPRPGSRGAVAMAGRRPGGGRPAACRADAVVRNPVWSSDEALFTNMVRVSPGEREGPLRLRLHVGGEGTVRRPRSSTTRAPRRSTRGTGTPGRARAASSGPSAGSRTPSGPTPSRCGWSRRTRTAASASASRARTAAIARAPRTRTARACATIRSRFRSRTGWRCSAPPRSGRRRSMPGGGRSRSIRAPCPRGWATRTGSPPEAGATRRVAQVRETLRLAPRHEPAIEKLKELEAAAPGRPAVSSARGRRAEPGPSSSGAGGSRGSGARMESRGSRPVRAGARRGPRRADAAGGRA